MVHQSAGVEPNRAIRSPRRLDKISSTRTAAGHSLRGARSGRRSFSTGRRAADGARGWVGSWPIRSRVAPVCSVPSRNLISYSDLAPPRTPFFEPQGGGPRSKSHSSSTRGARQLRLNFDRGIVPSGFQSFRFTQAGGLYFQIWRVCDASNCRLFGSICPETKKYFRLPA